VNVPLLVLLVSALSLVDKATLEKIRQVWLSFGSGQCSIRQNAWPTNIVVPNHSHKLPWDILQRSSKRLSWNCALSPTNKYVPSPALHAHSLAAGV